jgi:hypothetical protein
MRQMIVLVGVAVILTTVFRLPAIERQTHLTEASFHAYRFELRREFTMNPQSFLAENKNALIVRFFNNIDRL